MPTPLNTLDRMRLAHGAVHLHQLGADSIAELLAELTARVGGGAALFALLAEYERRVPPSTRSLGAGRSPARRRPRAALAELGRART